MKSTSLFAAILLVTSFLFTRCSPDYEYISSTDEIITRGNWSVDYFYSNQDNTAQYVSYQLEFGVSGAMRCVHGQEYCTGNWKVNKDINGKDVLEINLPATLNNVRELNDCWDVISSNSNSVNLRAKDDQSMLHLKKK
jgi:hypothetical protein